MRDRRIPRPRLLKGGAAAFACAGAGGARPVAFARAGTAETGGDARLVRALGAAAEPLPEIAALDFARFVDRFAEARVVLLGGSTHGTDEFYRARAAITERLIREHGFNVVAVEADWPDAARIDAHIRGHELPSPITPFQRFPVWMWRNRVVRASVDRLHAINREIGPERRVGFYGLDL